MTTHPAPSDCCSDCGTAVALGPGETRCPACFDRYLYGLDAGFLESYRRFGCRSHLIVAETCLRGLVLATPEHRKVLAMTIFERYLYALRDLAALFLAFRERRRAPILRSFFAFRLDAAAASEFFETVRSLSDAALFRLLELPLPAEASPACPHLSREEAHSLSVALHHLTQDLRRVTERGSTAALALTQLAGEAGGVVLAADAGWLDGAGPALTPDQVALFAVDSGRRVLSVHGLTADEGAMGRVVDAIDAATRAASNLIYAYLQANDL